MQQFEIGQELTFDVYGNIIKGTFMTIPSEKIIQIKVTFDSLGISEIDEISEINNTFLITASNED